MGMRGLVVALAIIGWLTLDGKGMKAQVQEGRSEDQLLKLQAELSEKERELADANQRAETMGNQFKNMAQAAQQFHFQFEQISQRYKELGQNAMNRCVHIEHSPEHLDQFLQRHPYFAKAWAYEHNQQTWLHEAALTSNGEKVLLLLKAGADPSQLNAKGETAFTICEKRHALQCMEVLRLTSPPSVSDRKPLVAVVQDPLP